MQELVLLLTGIAGAGAAAAYRRFPKNTHNLTTIGASSQIKEQVSFLHVEKHMLTKAIARLHKHSDNIGTTQRNRLLDKYQHQLGVILAKIENLETASKHPDLGPIGDGLLTLMDQKLSSLDQKLYEISGKIKIAEELPKEEKQKQPKKIQTTKVQTYEIPVPSIKQQSNNTFENITKDVNPSQSKIEIATLTAISGNSPSYTLPEAKVPAPVTTPPVSTTPPTVSPKPPTVLPTPKPPTPNITPTTTPKPVDVDIDDDDNIDKIKRDILKTLEKLDQAEVE